MCTYVHERLNVEFAATLDDSGFASWVGGNHESTAWLVAKWGDIYLHETVVSHIRRLLDTDFACVRLGETPSQLPKRMKKVGQLHELGRFCCIGRRAGADWLGKRLPRPMQGRH